MGNVWEWCGDWYTEDYYRSSPLDDPTGPSSGFMKVNRGGGWVNMAATCRSAFRNKEPPGLAYNNLGFRVACGLASAMNARMSEVKTSPTKRIEFSEVVDGGEG